ncbi:LLM class flavin-dependent oxidoreductase [Streptomyces avermitilis]
MIGRCRPSRASNDCHRRTRGQLSQPRGFQFALASDGDTTEKEWHELARQAVDLGYDALLVSDHVDQRLAPVPAVTVAAEVTDDLVVGTYVLNNDLRHPLMLPRDVASSHALSDGRFSSASAPAGTGSTTNAPGSVSSPVGCATSGCVRQSPSAGPICQGARSTSVRTTACARNPDRRAVMTARSRSRRPHGS